MNSVTPDLQCHQQLSQPCWPSKDSPKSSWAMPKAPCPAGMDTQSIEGGRERTLGSDPTHLPWGWLPLHCLSMHQQQEKGFLSPFQHTPMSEWFPTPGLLLQLSEGFQTPLPPQWLQDESTGNSRKKKKTTNLLNCAGLSGSEVHFKAQVII